MRHPLLWIAANTLADDFPDVREALDDPDGLLAAGGDLDSETLLRAYRRGIFPWYSHGQPILWWSPNPRSVFYPGRIRISRSLRKTLRQGRFTVTADTCFEAVLRGCAAPRNDVAGTWLSEEMMVAYARLHRLGAAHSIECHLDGELVGGLYGVSIGRVFFGESMFSRASDASKVALCFLSHNLKRWQYKLIDCQLDSPHLRSLGAVSLSRERFTGLLDRLCGQAIAQHAWEELEPPS